MQNKSYPGVICAAFLLAAMHAGAQGFFPPSNVITPIKGPGQGSTAIGPDGTYYALVPGTGSTMQTQTTDLVAIGPPSAPATKWTVSLSGELGQVLPGATNVYVVQTKISGSGRSATATTSVLLLSATNGSQVASVTPTGNIDDIEVRTIGGSDYLYIYTITTSSTSSAGTTTYTTTRTLTIYSPNATALRSVTL